MSATASAQSEYNTALAARLADGYEIVTALGDSRFTRDARVRKGGNLALCVVWPGKEPPMIIDEVGCIDITGGDGAK